MLRVVFMGTPEFAVSTLEAIVAAGHEIVAVYTQPPRRAHRGMKEQRSAVHELAAARGLHVLTPHRLRDATAQAQFSAHHADAAVVVAYGLILPRPILDAPCFGCLNLHASALPRWRGAAPIQRAVMAGDSDTAVMVMRMEEGLDTGPVCAEHRLAIGTDETAGELHDRLKTAGAQLMVDALGRLEMGSLRCMAQPSEGITYAAKIDKAETRIDFDRPSCEVHNHVRGLSPFPGAWLEIDLSGQPERLKILATTLAEGAGPPGTVLDGRLTIACRTGAVRILRLQRAGKRPMSADDVLRGLSVPPGTRF